MWDMVGQLDRSVGHGWTVGQTCVTWLDSLTGVWDMVGKLDRRVGHGWTVGQKCEPWLDSGTARNHKTSILPCHIF